MKLFDMIRLSRQNYSDEVLSRLTKADSREAKKLLVDLQLQTEMLTKKDIGAWRMAWQRAIDVQNPNRCALLDIYTDVSVDMHLTGCVGQRKGFVTKRGFKLVDKGGKKNDEVTALFETEWFDEFVSLVLDSRYYGHSLIQFDVPIDRDGQMQFPIPELVPRKHVRPEYGVIVRNQNDVPQSGISYREGEFADWCIEVGRPHDLGLYLKCCPSALSKKNMLAFWDGFGEIFGMPIRIAKTTSQDEKSRNKIQDMLAKMGAAFYGVFPNDTEIEIKESSRGDAYNVYDKRIDRANSELSKGVLNQTMTIDSGSSLSQSQVHLEVFENVINEDQKLVRNVVNNKLIPFMAKHGFPVVGYTFEWDDTVVYTPEHIREVERMLITGGYEIDPKYFADKYGIEITGKKDFFE
jgi:hypothetical protein